MLSYCLKCRKNTESKNPTILKTEEVKNNDFTEQCSLWS